MMLTTPYVGISFNQKILFSEKKKTKKIDTFFLRLPFSIILKYGLIAENVLEVLLLSAKNHNN
jgi:hypothetical protein